MDRSCSLWHPVDLVLDTISGCGCDATASQTKNLLLFKTVSESRWGARARSCDRRLAECPAPALWHRCAKAPGRGPAAPLGTDDCRLLIRTHSWLWALCWAPCHRPTALADPIVCARLLVQASLCVQSSRGPMRCNLPFFASGFHCHDTRGWQRFKREPQWNH